MRFLFFLSVLLYCLDVFANHQNRIRVSDPKDLALGKTSSNSGYVLNPAVSVLCRSPNLYISYLNLYQQKELGSWKCGYIYPGSFLHTFTSIESFGYEHYRELHFSLGMAKRLSAKLALGYQLHLFDFHYTGCEENEFLLSADIGTLFVLNRKFKFGLWVQNLLKRNLNGVENYFADFPISGLLSSNIAIGENSEWSLEVVNSDLKDWDIRNGLEYQMEMFSIRCGFATKPFSPGLGFGFKLHDFSLDVGGDFHKQLGYSFSLGIRVDF